MKLHRDDKVFVICGVLMVLIFLSMVHRANGHHNYGYPIPAIVKATESKGWPHNPTMAEIRAVPQRVIHTVTPRNYSGRVLCRWTTRSVSPAVCAVRLRRAYGEGPRAMKFRVRFVAWEDGSWLLETTGRDRVIVRPNA